MARRITEQIRESALLALVALVERTHTRVCVFWFGHHQKHREEATVVTLVKGKAADPSCLFEGRNCQVPPPATRDVFGRN